MDILYIGTVILFVFILMIVIPISYKAGKTKQKAYDIALVPPTVGTILIETSDPDGPYLFLDLEKPVDYIGQHTEVVCKINTNGISSRD